MKVTTLVVLACLVGFAFATHQCQFDWCQNGGTCHPTGNQVSQFGCVCPPGFQGTYCEQHIRTCADKDQAYCLNGATCVDTSSGSNGDMFYCMCAGNWTGTYCQQDGNYRARCASSTCQNGGTCYESGTTLYCSCATGYHGDLCQYQSFCDSNPCQNGGACREIVGRGYICQCPLGYVGANCQTSYNVTRYGCNLGSLDACNQNVGSYCSNDDADSVGATSGNLGVCANCRGGTQSVNYPNTAGPTCTAPILSGCTSNPCANLATCVATGTDGGYYCRCLNGFYGPICEHYVNQCNRNGTSCFNKGTCIQQSWNYNTNDVALARENWQTFCNCKSGWQGDDCSIKTSDITCANYGCQNGATCTVDLTGEPTCYCDRGFSGTKCEVVTRSGFTPACNSNPCMNGGQCLDTFDDYSQGIGYSCRCPQGFRGPRCNVQGTLMANSAWNFCGEGDANPCQNGATCVNDPRNAKYTCICTPRFTGYDCQLAGAYFRTASIATVFALIALVVLFL